MRLWHYLLIPYLPNSQLIAQWRELHSIFKKEDRHILINYVYEYPKENLGKYTALVIEEMLKRGFKPSEKSMKQVETYFSSCDNKTKSLEKNPFPRDHTSHYMRQCFYNLQEKYDRGQKDFDMDTYINLFEFVKDRIAVVI